MRRDAYLDGSCYDELCFLTSEAADAGDAGLASNERKIYVGSLTPSITEKPLKEYFSNFGDIIECKVRKGLRELSTSWNTS